MGFVNAVKEQYNKGRKMIDDYQEGAAKRDKEAAERFKKKTQLLKEKTKLQKAKADYQKAKASSGSMFGGGSSMFGGGSGATFGSNAPVFSGTIGNTREPQPLQSHTWGIGGGMAQDKPKAARKPKKRRASSKGVKKVVYYR